MGDATYRGYSEAAGVEDDHSTDYTPVVWSSGDPREDLYIIGAASIMELGPRDTVKDMVHILRLCPAVPFPG